MKKSLILLLLILLNLSIAQNSDFNFASWDNMLQKYLANGGRVDYSKWQANDQAALDKLIADLAKFDPNNLGQNAEIAFWVNSYNILAVSEVLSRYPIDTVRPEFLFIPERSFFTDKKHTINNTKYSLDSLENDILRAKYQQPLIHFSIVCASNSCPNLRPEAYNGDNVIEQLKSQARKFIADNNKNEFSGNTAQLSKIFDWFKADFESASGSVKEFLLPYATSQIKQVLNSDNLQIKYLDYNWGLNDLAKPWSR